jgi:hypothetical protein
MAAKNERINFELPAVPHSLRGFIERAVKDRRTMLSFVESPLTALRAAGVPIKENCLTKNDCDRFIRVLGNIRELVKSKKIAKDFRFEDIFTIGSTVFYEQTKSSTDSYIEKNFDHSEEGHDMEDKTSTEEGIHVNFNSGFPVRNFDDIIAPLLNPGDLAAIAVNMSAQLRTMFPG